MQKKSEFSEKALELSHFTIEKAGDAIFWYGSNAKFQRVNEAACRHLGYSREELLDMTVFDINPDLNSETFPRVWDLVRKEGTVTLETRHRTRKGEFLPVEVSCNFIEFEGKGYCCSFVRDISRRRDLEKRLRFSDITIENAPDTVFWIDSQARIHRVNETASRRLGYTRDEILSMTVFDINPDLSREEWESHWKTLQANKVLTLETRHKRKDGSTYPVEILQNHVVFEGQEYSCGFVRDLTERKRAEENLTRLMIEKEKIENELKLASMIQKEFLPDNPPSCSGFDSAAQAVPAKFVGGDFFDFIKLDDNRWAIVLGDVAGKGVSAALHMARLMGDFRNLVQTSEEPVQVMTGVNQLLSARAKRGMFATAVFFLIDLKTKTLKISNAGHHPIIIRTSENRVLKKAATGGIPLGIFSDFLYTSEEVEFKSGDLILVFSDGAVESHNSEKEIFGLDRLCDFISKDKSPPETLIINLHKTIQNFSEGFGPHDDVTFLAIQVF